MKCIGTREEQLRKSVGLGSLPVSGMLMTPVQEVLPERTLQNGARNEQRPDRHRRRTPWNRGHD